jgi:hypothetical protein
MQILKSHTTDPSYNSLPRRFRLSGGMNPLEYDSLGTGARPCPGRPRARPDGFYTADGLQRGVHCSSRGAHLQREFGSVVARRRLNVRSANSVTKTVRLVAGRVAFKTRVGAVEGLRPALRRLAEGSWWAAGRWTVTRATRRTGLETERRGCPWLQPNVFTRACGNAHQWSGAFRRNAHHHERRGWFSIGRGALLGTVGDATLCARNHLVESLE